MMNQHTIKRSNDRHLAKLPAKADLRPYCLPVYDQEQPGEEWKTVFNLNMGR